MKKSYYVVFEVLHLPAKKTKGSTVEIGERFVGEFFPYNRIIQFTDINCQEWIFKSNKDAKIITTFT